MVDFFCHPSAVIDDGAEIGTGTKVWHFSHICSGARIGRNVSLGQNVYVGSKAIVGNGCKIQNNVSVYDNVELDEDVFCGPSVVFTNVYNPRSSVNRKNEYLKTLVERGTTIGANATLICGIKIGRYGFVGAGAVINTDVKNYALMVGVPAKQIGWMSEYGERVPLPLNGEGVFHCPHSSKVYHLRGSELFVT